MRQWMIQRTHCVYSVPGTFVETATRNRRLRGIQDRPLPVCRANGPALRETRRREPLWGLRCFLAY